MWIFLNDAFLSVVAHRDQPDTLLVRSRGRGDIERAVPSAEVFEDGEADYRFRALVPRQDLAQALVAQVDKIDYPNFKGSVADRHRHEAYMKVWAAMAAAYGAYGREVTTQG